MTETSLLAEVAALIPGFLYIYEKPADGGPPRFLYASAGIETIVGVSREEAMQDAAACWSRVHPDDVEMVRGSIEQSRKGGVDWDCAFRLVHPSRGLVWLHGRATAQKLQDGSYRWFGFHHDVTEARAAEEAIKQARAESVAAEARLRTAVEAMSEGFALYDSNDRLVLANEGYRRLFAPCAVAPGRGFEELLREFVAEGGATDAKGRAEEWIQQVFAARAAAEGRNQWTTGDGRSIVTRHHRLENGDLFSFHADRTEERRSQELLRQRSAAQAAATRLAEAKSAALTAKCAQLDQFFSLSIDLLGILEPSGAAIRLSHAWCDLVGRPMEELMRTPYRELLHKEDWPKLRATIRAIADGGPCAELRCRWRRKDGAWRVIDWRGKRGADGLIYIVARDVTAEIAAENRLREAKICAESRATQLLAANRRIEHNALHDPLTGLPNRRYLEQVLNARLHCGGGIVAALHLDLDRFKQINDADGHAAGDAVLRQTAALLSSQLRDGDFLARVGGDEFVVIPERITDADDLHALSERLIAVLRRPIEHDGKRHRVGVSIGAALRFGEEVDDAALLEDADIALYKAKAEGGGRVEFFTEALREETLRRKKTADRLRAALDDGEFEPFYQPQICARTGRVIGVEALARWRHPVDGMLTPDRFIGPAQEMGLLGDIDRQVMERGLRDLERLRVDGVADLRLAVNVSAKRLLQAGLVAEIEALDLAPGRLSFELVETILIEEADAGLMETAAALRRIGVDIELDDFGSGHASIVGLLKLRPSRLKIDRRLVMPMLDGAQEHALVRSILEIGRALEVEVIAEGVETLRHAEVLARLGCDILQGFAYAKPLPLDQLRALLSSPPWLERPSDAIEGSVA